MEDFTKEQLTAHWTNFCEMLNKLHGTPAYNIVEDSMHIIRIVRKFKTVDSTRQIIIFRDSIRGDYTKSWKTKGHAIRIDACYGLSNRKLKKDFSNDIHNMQTLADKIYKISEDFVQTIISDEIRKNEIEKQLSSDSEIIKTELESEGIVNTDKYCRNRYTRFGKNEYETCYSVTEGKGVYYPIIHFRNLNVSQLKRVLDFVESIQG
jgi:hypothetical protein